MTSKKIVFTIGSRVNNFLVAVVTLLALSLYLMHMGYESFHDYGLEPADGGVLKSSNERLGFVLALGFPGLGVLVATVIFMHRFIIEISTANRSTLKMKTLAVWGISSRLVKTGDLCIGTRKSGQYSVHGGPAMQAPYRLIYRRGQLIPYVLDMQGKLHDRGIISSMRCKQA